MKASKKLKDLKPGNIFNYKSDRKVFEVERKTVDIITIRRISGNKETSIDIELNSIKANKEVEKR